MGKISQKLNFHLVQIVQRHFGQSKHQCQDQDIFLEDDTN